MKKLMKNWELNPKQAGSTPAASTTKIAIILRRAALLTFLILSVFCPFPGWAADPWSKQDLALEGIYLALKTIDMGQTLDIARQSDRYYECNPILGRHPPKSAVYAYFLGMAMVHIGVVHVLPAYCRPWFQGVTIGLSGACVINNYSIGLQVRF